MSGHNKDLQVPSLSPFVLSDTANLNPTLRGLDVWAAGNVKITDIEGNSTTRTFAAPFPVRWALQIRRVWATGTTVNSDNTAGATPDKLDGLH